MRGTLSHETSRYALPAYIPLLVCTGALVVGASRWSRTVGAGLLAFLLLFAGWTNVRFLWPLSPAMRARQAESIAALERVRHALAARPVEALYVDDTMHAFVWAFLLDRPTVSMMARDVYVPHAVATDAAERIDILAAWDADRVAADLAAVGATWEPTSILGWRLFENVRVPGRRYRMVPRSAWRVMGDPNVAGLHGGRRPRHGLAAPRPDWPARPARAGPRARQHRIAPRGLLAVTADHRASFPSGCRARVTGSAGRPSARSRRSQGSRRSWPAAGQCSDPGTAGSSSP